MDYEVAVVFLNHSNLPKRYKIDPSLVGFHPRLAESDKSMNMLT